MMGQRQELQKPGEASAHNYCDARPRTWLRPTQIALSVACLIVIWLVFGEPFKLYLHGKIPFSELATWRRSINSWVVLFGYICFFGATTYEAFSPRRIVFNPNELQIEGGLGHLRKFPIQALKRVKGRKYNRTKNRWTVSIAGRWLPVHISTTAWHNERQLMRSIFDARPDLATPQNIEILREGR